MRIAGAADAPDRLVRIVGVVSDAHNQPVRESDETGYVYCPATSSDLATLPMSFVLKGDKVDRRRWSAQSRRNRTRSRNSKAQRSSLTSASVALTRTQ
jgi:hypothetical protein